MAISRMQMNRQLYAGGGIMDVTPRENFGLGSKLKKFVRKVIPNEIADVAVKAAPFVAPFNPLIAAGMAGLGGFDQTGSISKSLRSGALTYGLGNLARVVGGAGFQGGLKAPGTGTGFGSYFTSPMSGQQLFGAQAPVVDSGATVQSLDEIVGSGGGIEEYLYKTDPSKLTLGQQADIIAQQVGGGTPKTGYSDIFGRIVGKGSTFGERAQAIKELGGKALKDIYTTDKNKLDKNALFSTIAGVGSYIEAKKLLDDAGEDTEGYTEEMYEADKAKYMEKYRESLNPEQFYATGGRVKLETGGIPSIMLAKKEYNFMDLIDKEGEDEYYEKKAEELDRKYNPERYKQILPKEKPMDKYMLDEIMSEKGMNTLSEGTRDDAMKMYAEKAFKKGQISEAEYNEIMGIEKEAKYPDIKMADGGRVGYKIGSKPKEDEEGIMSVKIEMEDEDKENMMMADAPGITFTTSEKSYLFKTLAGQGGSDRSFTMPQLYGILNNPNSDKNIDDAKALKSFLKMKGFKTGGRVQYAMGSEIPVRENQAGVSEMDFRETGGFVPPIGVKEKADDIPAMLSNNEFVFTADAVRAAGGGSVNKGAQKMYTLMKQLEGKVV
jgi:DNA-binding ferritin-like protein (Dps family)